MSRPVLSGAAFLSVSHPTKGEAVQGPRRKIAHGVAVFFALAACSYPGEEPDLGSKRTEQGIEDNLADLRYPIEQAELSINQRYAQYYAEDMLMGPCMEAAGFEWKPIKPPRQFVSADRRRYGIMDLAAAVNYGYHLPPPPQEASNRIERENALTPAERKAAFGVNGLGGCYRAAHKKIAGPIPEVDLKLFNTLNRKSLQESRGNPKVVQAVAAWRRCMARSGYTYSDPFGAAGDSRWGGGAPSGKEKVAATADIECKRSVDLIATWADAEYSLQEEYIRQNADYFSRIDSSKREQMKNMKKVLHGDGYSG